MADTPTIGAYIAHARKAAGLTLRSVAEHVGISVPFLFEVEHDTRRLNTVHWAALCEVLPGVTLRGLAAVAVAAGKVTIDASSLTRKQREAFTDALVQAVERAA